MAIAIKESFQVAAPIARVWEFLLDAHQVVACMPGAGLEEVVDDRTFLGTMRVKVGPIVASYKGRVQFTTVDAEEHAIEMVAEGLETGGGSAKGTMSSHLRELADGKTEVVSEATAEITGRIAQFGQGMIVGVSHELFQQFVACATGRLEAAPGAVPEAAAAGEKQPVSILPLALKALWSAIVRFFRRLFGGSPS